MLWITFCQMTVIQSFWLANDWQTSFLFVSSSPLTRSSRLQCKHYKDNSEHCQLHRRMNCYFVLASILKLEWNKLVNQQSLARLASLCNELTNKSKKPFSLQSSMQFGRLVSHVIYTHQIRIQKAVVRNDFLYLNTTFSVLFFHVDLDKK